MLAVNFTTMRISGLASTMFGSTAGRRRQDRCLSRPLSGRATVGALFLALTAGGANPGVRTLQPTAASQKYLPPPGFQAWDGGPVTPVTSVWSAPDAAASGATLSNGGLTVMPSLGGHVAVNTHFELGRQQASCTYEFPLTPLSSPSISKPNLSCPFVPPSIPASYLGDPSFPYTQPPGTQQATRM